MRGMRMYAPLPTTSPPSHHLHIRAYSQPQEHAPEVLALPGVTSAIKYTALPLPSPNSHSTTAPTLITYEFPSLSYTSSPAFAAVANTPPSPQLVQRIYAHTSFDIRFYAELPSPAPAAAHASLRDLAAGEEMEMACITLSPTPGREREFPLWFAKGMHEALVGVRGFVRLRRFELVGGGRRERNVVGAGPEGAGYLVLAVFEGGRRRGEVEGCFGEGVCAGEVGWYGVKRVWAEGDVGEVGEGV